MIVVQIFGGLGNQLFQIAAGRALAVRLGVEMQIDTRYFQKQVPIQDDICLHHFAHSAREARPSMLPASPQDGLCRFLSAKLSGRDRAFFRETSLAYDPGFATLGDGTVLRGYWQSEKYFRDQSDAVRESLQISTQPSAKNRQTLKDMGKCLPVSLHIRRGDYVTSTKFSAMYGTCDLEYYGRAVAHIASGLASEPVIYAFSDDPDWVRDNLKLPFETRYINHNSAATSYEDIRLMSACQHHIVANSSYSWWGAWLNPRPDKVVVAPVRWFADPKMEDHDIVPEDWVRL